MCNVRTKIGASLLLWIVSACALAQAYPSRPVKVVVPYSAGTGVDVVARLVTETISKNIGQPFVVENRAGAAGSIGTAYVAAAPADGYTVLVNSSALTTVPALQAKLPFDTARDLVGITTLAENPLVMVSSPKRFKTAQELVAAAKAKPGALTFASAGIGTGTHMSAEKFRLGAGIDTLHIPFKSTTDAMAEIMSGRMDYTYTSVTSVLSGIREGRLVALAMSSRRSALLPDVPTIAEAGFPNAAYSSWIGMVVAANTPREIVNRLYQETLKAVASAELKERLAKIGTESSTMPPTEFDALIRRELVENERLVKAAGIKIQ